MKLSLAEGLYLIALDDEEGRLLSSAVHSIDRALIGISILELAIQGRVELDGDAHVTVVNKSGTGNKILDDILKFAIQGKKKITDLIEFSFEHYKDIQHDITLMLINRGIIRKESTKLLWIPVSERMDNANYAFEAEIRKNLHKMAIKGIKGPATLVVLITMIYYCNLMEEVFRDKDELIDANKFVRDLPNQGWVDEHMNASLGVLKSYFANYK